MRGATSASTPPLGKELEAGGLGRREEPGAHPSSHGCLVDLEVPVAGGSSDASRRRTRCSTLSLPLLVSSSHTFYFAIIWIFKLDVCRSDIEERKNKFS